MRRHGLWREPDFLKLWAGQAVSQVGSGISSVGLPLAAILILGASPLFGIYWEAGSLFVSDSLAAKSDLGLEELSTVRDQLSPLISRSDDASVGVIETADACAMLHSFYTEIEKTLKLVLGILIDECRPPTPGISTSVSWSVHRSDAVGEICSAGCQDR